MAVVMHAHHCLASPSLFALKVVEIHLMKVKLATLGRKEKNSMQIVTKLHGRGPLRHSLITSAAVVTGYQKYMGWVVHFLGCKLKR